MTSREFATWKVYNRMSPDALERADIHAAQTAWTMSCLWGKAGKAGKVTDHILKFQRKKATWQTKEQIIKAAKHFRDVMLGAGFGKKKKK